MPILLYVHLASAVPARSINTANAFSQGSAAWITGINACPKLLFAASILCFKTRSWFCTLPSVFAMSPCAFLDCSIKAIPRATYFCCSFNSCPFLTSPLRHAASLMVCSVMTKPYFRTALPCPVRADCRFS